MLNNTEERKYVKGKQEQQFEYQNILYLIVLSLKIYNKYTIVYTDINN